MAPKRDPEPLPAEDLPHAKVASTDAKRASLGLSSNDPELQKAALLYYTEHASTVVRGRLVLALDLCKRVLRQAAGEEGEQRFNATHTDLAQAAISCIQGIADTDLELAAPALPNYCDTCWPLPRACMAPTTTKPAAGA